ncbi:hypothetical protein [Longispora albida]|uniref:hypothetical protein n=1 Tax=Longispora albida TaxID=203523 RepID=UPI000363F55E|nr:hypothetical protein [Longispora albida]
MSQLSFFAAEATDRSPLDLAGLLAGPGQLVRMGGTARVSVVVADEWRAQALLGEYAARGLGGELAPAVEDRISIRTAYVKALAPLASWLHGAVKRPPAGLELDGHKLRLWAIAAGSPGDNRSYDLHLGHSDPGAWAQVGQAIERAGLPAELVGPRAGGPAYRITGQRRMSRLAELVGPPPRGAPDGEWPVRKL